MYDRKHIIKIYSRELILLFMVAGFVYFKIPHLSLPYFWDEGFAYGPAVNKMYQDGLSILPYALPPDFSYGHPLFFHFCAAGWMKLFGSSQIATKSFALFVSVLLLFSLYSIIQKKFNKDSALLAVALLILQPVFLAQSSLLLLEIMVSLLGLWTIYFWLEKRWWLFGIFASLLVMTKESGLFVIFALGVWQLIDFFILRSEKVNFKIFLKRFLILSVPAFVFGIFLIAQKLTYGWFFYPLRIADMNTTTDGLLNAIKVTRYVVFFRHGRGYVTFALFVALLVYYFVPGKKFSSEQWRFIWFFTLFTFIFKYVSIFNFVSNRYFMIIHVCWIAIAAVMVIMAFDKYKFLMYFAALMLIFSQAINAGDRGCSGDDCLSSVDVVKVHKEVVNYLEANHLYHERIYTHFLMRENLYRTSIGYLSSDQLFDNLTDQFNNNVKYCVITNVEDYQTSDVRGLPQLRLLKRFELGTAWGEIYYNDSCNMKQEQVGSGK